MPIVCHTTIIKSVSAGTIVFLETGQVTRDDVRQLELDVNASMTC
jgi:hypothetical protein